MSRSHDLENINFCISETVRNEQNKANIQPMQGYFMQNYFDFF